MDWRNGLSLESPANVPQSLISEIQGGSRERSVIWSLLLVYFSVLNVELCKPCFLPSLFTLAVAGMELH
jgi:hypothetical protein